jgi:hypothetical protein
MGEAGILRIHRQNKKADQGSAASASQARKLGLPSLQLLHPCIELCPRPLLGSPFLIEPMLKRLLLLNNGSARRCDLTFRILQLSPQTLDLTVERISFSGKFCGVHPSFPHCKIDEDSSYVRTKK